MGLFHDCETLNFAKGRSKLWLGGCGWVLLAGGVSGNPSIYFSFVLSGSQVSQAEPGIVNIPANTRNHSQIFKFQQNEMVTMTNLQLGFCKCFESLWKKNLSQRYSKLQFIIIYLLQINDVLIYQRGSSSSSLLWPGWEVVALISGSDGRRTEGK